LGARAVDERRQVVGRWRRDAVVERELVKPASVPRERVSHLALGASSGNGTDRRHAGEQRVAEPAGLLRRRRQKCQNGPRKAAVADAFLTFAREFATGHKTG